MNAPDTIFANTTLEPATCPKASRAKEPRVPANSGRAHLSGAHTKEAAVGQEENGTELEQSIGNLLVRLMKNISDILMFLNSQKKGLSTKDPTMWWFQGIGIASNRNMIRF